MIILATTTITIKGRRSEEDYDPLAIGFDGVEEPTPTTVTTTTRATITLPKGTRDAGSQKSTHVLSADPCDLRIQDTVIDNTTGLEYEVVTAVQSDTQGFGLEHTQATLKLMTGYEGGQDDGSA